MVLDLWRYFDRVQIEAFSEAWRDSVVALCAAEGWIGWTPEKVERAFSAPGVLAVVAFDGDEIVGVAELLTDGEVMAYRTDLLSQTDSMPFYESLDHKAKPGYRIYDGS